MKELKLKENNLLRAEDFYNELFRGQENVTRFNMWFARRTREYGLILGTDYFAFVAESTGGRPKIEYSISLDCAKVLCMVEKTEKSMDYRNYLISLEKSVNKQELLRQVGIETRKTMTDKIQESGINEKMHGFGYSNFTKLVYKKCGIEYAKTEKFRDTLNAEQLKVVEQYEKIIGTYIEMGFNYTEIKNQLPDFVKSITDLEVKNG